MTKVVLATPIGGIGVLVDQGSVCGVSFGAVPGGEPTRAELERGGPVLSATLEQLREYFAGERTDFDLPVQVRRGSEFERAVWAEIAQIPYGETLSYGAIARAVGDAGAAQAVGHACNRNPLPIIVACHRVIGSDGKLVGFGGGLDRKRCLLSLEARVSIDLSFSPN